ncbi:flocculation protein FLO11-like [Cucumis melo var. makuwa]|uniref:Flocculation protein FLO11-like n=1 Tax=Cucumis melo var. makuwa TaxID=1194695 RepID=A0A5A7TEV9_CUCMM|nr:flocculation protein FLO11-like [Cucumis melo var. makuwa]TYK06336.1 flocculation protein FLO11-like [Cucumis melo var. makuwa]
MELMKGLLICLDQIIHQGEEDSNVLATKPPRPSFRHPSKGQRVISIKVGRRKLSSNVHYVPIDGISFHYEECVFKWKYVMQRRLECCALTNLGVFYPKLVREFIIDLLADFNEPVPLIFKSLPSNSLVGWYKLDLQRVGFLRSNLVHTVVEFILTTLRARIAASQEPLGP